MFQQKIVNKYLSNIDPKLLAEKYALFCSIFGNKEKQGNIRNSKEEQYQEGFIRDLFCSILGYTIKPEVNYNIFTEAKNESKSSKKADGAIVINGEIKAVIELKGTDIQDLDKVADQAFSYKNHHEKCNYVIVSNFERLRLYVETQIDYQEFNLFNLNKKSFDLLYLLLSLEQITSDTPLKLKHETLTEEKEITDKFYLDYSTFKRKLFEDLVKNNPDTDKLLLFKKTQKLLDRILFVLFCEDRGLLPTNSTMEILNIYKKLKELGYYQSLYSVFKTFFDKIDKGFHHETDNSKDVFAYNGGLFKPDEILDTVKVSDDVLYIHSQKLANYDFESQISVDILGRIFENSLTEIEEIQKGIEAEKNGIQIGNINIGKRKKDGVFYTPEYITKYIVEKTIGKLCEAKKDELKINDNEFTSDKKRQRKTIYELDERLKLYRAWLLNLKILDCACGSGAFLNAALKELRKEHTIIDYLWAKIHKNELNFSQIDNTILENNLYGVDINEESVEITKLSLWLNTTTRNRKLTTLNDKIKCGNSLIDDESIAREKAFNWQKEFPEVFEKGGFDVIIGNPPYGAEFTRNEKDFIESNYSTYEYQVNSYVVFYERAFSLLKQNGYLGFITPATFTYQHYFKKLRQYLQNYSQVAICKYMYEVFPDADIGYAVSWIMRKTPNFKESVSCEIYKSENDISPEKFVIDYNKLVASDSSYSISNNSLDTKKLYTNAISLTKITNVVVGVKAYQKGKGTPKQDENVVDKKIYSASFKKDDTYIQCVVGKDFHRYKFLANPKLYISYGIWLAEPREGAPFFDDEKIILRQTSDSLIGTIDKEKRINLNNVYNIGKKDERYNLYYILALLNSRLLNFLYQSIAQEKGRNFAEVKKVNLAKLPIKDIPLEKQKPFIGLAEKMLVLNEDLRRKANRFIDRIKETYNIDKITQNIECFYNLSFTDFVRELTKQKIKLSMKQKDELEDYFNEYVQDISILNKTIAKTDAEINALVYGLYNLTEEEIRIIESNQ